MGAFITMRGNQRLESLHFGNGIVGNALDKEDTARVAALKTVLGMNLFTESGGR